jgi:2-polyprenyl-3-methyl-5-hydroxy-6-metoxy-1,4-benzoquinol methylase
VTTSASTTPDVAHVLDDPQGRIYKNNGNAPLLALLDSAARMVLDVGCGAGDNAALLRTMLPQCEVHGVTHSPTEAQMAEKCMAACWVFDIEGEIPAELAAIRFDTLIFSHVLEHLRDPAVILKKFTALLRPGGCVAIAVPNVLSWAMRWRFVRGNFEYESDGVLDDTHLRFFTYLTADRYLLGKSPELNLVSKSTTGSVPQWWLRRHLLPKSWSARIDAVGCRVWPNLFGDQVLLKAISTAREPELDWPAQQKK